MRMIDKDHADRIRAGHDHGDCDGVIQYGHRETVTGTGRAICRVCGQKITRGQKAHKFPWDIGDCGSFTATTIQIHANTEDCNHTDEP